MSLGHEEDNQVEQVRPQYSGIMFAKRHESKDLTAVYCPASKRNQGVPVQYYDQDAEYSGAEYLSTGVCHKFYVQMQRN